MENLSGKNKRTTCAEDIHHRQVLTVVDRVQFLASAPPPEPSILTAVSHRGLKNCPDGRNSTAKRSPKKWRANAENPLKSPLIFSFFHFFISFFFIFSFVCFFFFFYFDAFLSNMFLCWHYHQSLTVSSVVGAPWRCGVLTT